MTGIEYLGTSGDFFSSRTEADSFGMSMLTLLEAPVARGGRFSNGFTLEAAFKLAAR